MEELIFDLMGVVALFARHIELDFDGANKLHGYFTGQTYS